MLRRLASRPFFGFAALLGLGALLAAMYVPEADARDRATGARILLSVLFVGLSAALVAAGFYVGGRRRAASRAAALSLLLLSPFPLILFAVFGMPFTALMLVGAAQVGFRNTTQDWRRQVEAQWAAERDRRPPG